MRFAQSEQEFRIESMPPEVRSAFHMGPLAWPLAVQRAIAAGIRDSGALANLVFFMHHPERKGRELHRSEPDYEKLAKEWRAWRTLVEPMLSPKKATSGAAKPGTKCVVSKGNPCARCGECHTCEKRLIGNAPAALPARLITAPKELRAPGRSPQLDEPAAQAFQSLIRAARSEGIEAPYLTITSGYRPYNVQASLWRGRLLRKLGLTGATKDHVAAAIERANRARDGFAWPQGKNAWLSQFLLELGKLGNPIPSDSARSAVHVLSGTTAPPGRSAHETGRAVDINVGHARGYMVTDASLPNVKWQREHQPYGWMVCNAARFGFYPYNREPWHWEYNP